MRIRPSILLAALLLAPTPPGIHAAPMGTSVAYQGKLREANSPANGIYDFQFSLWDDPGTGTRFGTTQDVSAVTVSNGLFAVTLDFGPTAFNGEARWLEVSVRTNQGGAFTTLSPRQPVPIVPYALYAPRAGTAATASQATAADSVPWTGITEVPTSFTDGIDNDTTYSAGTGLSLTGTRFSTLFGGTGTAATSARSDHNHAGTYASLAHTHSGADITSGVLTLGTSTNAAPPAGTIRWTGTAFEGYTGTRWVTLSELRTSYSNLVWISPGTFTLGSPATEQHRGTDEGPQTVVTLSKGFWIGKYEVTQGEYAAVMGNNPSQFTGDLSRPVEQVRWLDATNYCGRRTQQEQTAGRIPSDFSYRLPTEAEWEHACRAGTSTRFSHGDDPGYANLTRYAWYSANSGGTTHPVGQKLPNPWGLYDMHGNVSEWCGDWYGPYPGGFVIDLPSPATVTYRVIRNGSWFNPPEIERSARRNPFVNTGDNVKSASVGFRVVLASGTQ